MPRGLRKEGGKVKVDEKQAKEGKRDPDDTAGVDPLPEEEGGHQE